MTRSMNTRSTKTPSRTTSRSTDAERGFTLIELLVVVAIIGILAAIVVPAYQYAQLKAKATGIITDFKLFRDVVTQYHSDTGNWPPEIGRSREPPVLATPLKGKIQWSQRGYAYDYQYWLRPNGRPRLPQSGIAVGLAVWSRDPEILAMVEKLWDGPPLYRRNRRQVVFLIEPI